MPTPDENNDYPNPEACDHRWDYLKFTGGWGQASVAYIDCDNCNGMFYLPIEALRPRRGEHGVMPEELRKRGGSK